MSDSHLAPLAGLRVLDLSVGMAPALAAKLLVGAGADVTRMEPPSGDPFYEVYPAYASWHRGKRTVSWSTAQQDSILSVADLCIVGGEDFPSLDWAHDAEELHQRHPNLTVLEFRPQPVGFRPTPAVDLLLQARSGLCFEHFSDRPIAYAFAAPSYGAALQGVAAALACIYSQRRGAPGRHVSTSLLQGALFWGASMWLDLDGAEPAGEPRIPKDPRQLIFHCSDGMILQVTMGVPGALSRLHRVLGIESDVSNTTDRGIPTGKGDPRNFFGDVDLLAPYFALRPGSELLPELWEAGLVAEKVADPGECWDHPQTKANGIIATADDGTRGIGLPFALDRAAATKPCHAPAAVPPRLPLEGVRIVDCGSFVAGPYASVPLTDLGAAVVKIEPIGGDPMRALLGQYAPANRGKRSIAVDAKHPEGNRVMRTVCEGADIVHHNFRPGASARLGIDHVGLSKNNPDIIVLESSAYGARGPNANRPGFDMALQAMSGLERRGGTTTEPMWCRFAAADYSTALLGSVGVLTALVAKTLHGGGAGIETNLLNGALFLMSELVQAPDGSFSGMAPPPDDDQLGPHPAERLYEAKDGWIAIAARDDAMAARLLKTLDITEDLPRSEWGRAQIEAIGSRLADLTGDEALKLLDAADVWAERCERDGWAAAKADPRLVACGMIGEGIASGRGTITQIMRAFDLDGSGPSTLAQGLVDTVGGHSRAILRESEFPDDETERLIQSNVVRTTDG